MKLVLDHGFSKLTLWTPTQIRWRQQVTYLQHCHGSTDCSLPLDYVIILRLVLEEQGAFLFLRFQSEFVDIL